MHPELAPFTRSEALAVDHATRRSHSAYLGEDTVAVQDLGGARLASRNGPIKRSRIGQGRAPLWTFLATDINGKVWSCRHYPHAGTAVRMYPLADRRKS